MFKPILLLALIGFQSLMAHTAVMTCFNNGDNTITCEGGFSDGSSGMGVTMYIKQNDKKTLEGVMNEDSEFTFNMPSGEYAVYFDAGESHVVTIKGEDIVE